MLALVCRGTGDAAYQATQRQVACLWDLLADLRQAVPYDARRKMAPSFSS